METLEEDPLNPWDLQTIVESEVQDACSEEDFPNLLATEDAKDPNTYPFNSTKTDPDEGNEDSNVALMLGLSTEKYNDSLGDDWALDKIKLSPPSTDEESLHIIVDADIHIEALHTDVPNLAEEE